MSALTLFEKLNQIESRYDEMTAQLSSPDVHADSARYQKLARSHAELGEMVEKYREWKQIEKGLREARQLQTEAGDPEMKQLAHDEEKQLDERKEAVERDLSSCSCRGTRTTKRTSCWKFAPAPAATKRRSLPENCSGCTPATPNRRHGASKCWKVRRRRSAD
jgi:hypothetical protein